MSIRAACPCGKAFLAAPNLAGKVVKCPACGGAFRVPQPAPATPATVDPLRLDDLANMDFGALPAATPAQASLSTRATYTAARPKKSGGGGFPRGLKIGLIVGGVVVTGIVGLGVVLALLLPAIQAARAAAREVAARNATAGNVAARSVPAGNVVTGNVGTPPSGGRWQTYNSPTGGYSISMPRMPQTQSQPRATPAGLVMATVAVVDMGSGGAYCAVHADAPLGASWEATLDSCIQEGLRSMNGRTVTARDLTVAGKPARECDFEGTTLGQPCCGRIQMFRNGNTQYQLMWVGPNGKKPESDLQQFFSSVQLTRAAAPTTPSPPGMPPPIPPVTFPGSAPPSGPPPAPTSPFSPAPVKPGELSDAQRKSIYQGVASFERLTEITARQADGLEQAGQREAAASIRQSREEGRKGIVRTLANGNGISEAQVEEIYQTGKREKWGG